jgi:amicyanin
MKISIKKLLFAPVLIVLLAAGCNAQSDASSNQSNSASSESSSLVEANTVQIKDFKFNPATLTIKKGTTITWTNQDDARHNVVAQGDNASTGPKSELLGQGEKYTFTFDTVGTFEYLCEPHPYMKGSVVVTE